MMTSNVGGRAILKALRRRPPERRGSVSLEVSPDLPKRKFGGGKNSSREKVLPQNVPAKPLSTCKVSKSTKKSQHASAHSSSVSREHSRLSVEEMVSSSSKTFDSKSFKIPKKNVKVVGTVSSVLHAGDKVLNERGESARDTKIRHAYEDHRTDRVEEDSSKIQEYEYMDWETTVQEIKGLWPGTHLIKNNEFNVSGPYTRPATSVDIEMDVDSEPIVSLIIVPDTNIWIHRLSLIRELLDTTFPSYSEPIVVIPWMVLQELDVHGKNPRGPSRAAIHFIHRNLRANHPRIKGQKASDAVVVDPSFNRLNADDSILQCALQCHKEDTTVVLLTNDTNLKNKAMVNSVLAADSYDGVKSIRDTLQGKNANTNNNSSPSLSSASAPVVKKPDIILNLFRNREQTTSRTPCNTNTVSTSVHRKTDENPANRKRTQSYNSPRLPSSEVKKQKQSFSTNSTLSFADSLSLIHQTFSHIVTSKMKEDYGDPDWLNVVKIPPPWTAKSVVQCIIKHYVAVFTEVFGRKVSLAEKLLRLIGQYEAGNFSNAQSQTKRKYEEDIIECVLGMFAAGEFAMDDIIRKDPKVAICRQTLVEYRSHQTNNE